MGVHPTRPARACDIDRHVVVRSPSRQGVPTVAIDSPRLTTQTAGWILVVVAVSAAVLGVAHPVDSANRCLASRRAGMPTAPGAMGERIGCPTPCARSSAARSAKTGIAGSLRRS